MARAILFDSTLCVGCRACEEACAERWGLPYNDRVAKEEYLSDVKLTTIKTQGERYVRRLCMHCQVPTCVSVCPVGAIQKTSLGPVIYDEDRCIGCRYCMLACPFQVPTYEWNNRLPKVRKCDMCYQRQLEGKPTACAEACPTGATICGDRDALIFEGQKRIREKPESYFPWIYGRRDVGGTSVLILAAVGFDQLGLKTNLPQTPLPPLTWNVLSHVPDVVTLGGVLLGGVWWITHRRGEVEAAEGGAKKDASEEPRR